MVKRNGCELVKTIVAFLDEERNQNTDIRPSTSATAARYLFAKLKQTLSKDNATKLHYYIC